MAQTTYGRPRGVQKHRQLDMVYPNSSVSGSAYGSIRFGAEVLVCTGSDDGLEGLGFIGGPINPDDDAFSTVARLTWQRTGLELSRFGVARFVIGQQGDGAIGQVVTCRASERMDASKMAGAEFMPVTDVMSRLSEFRPGTPELIAQVATMGYGFNTFVTDAHIKVLEQHSLERIA